MYPQGLSQDQFERARQLRAQLRSKGVRESEIVDALERQFGIKNGGLRQSTSQDVRLGSQAQGQLLNQLINHWSSLNWHRPLKVIAKQVPLANQGELYILAFDSSGPTLALIELQLDRDEVEVVQSLEFYVAFMKAAFLEDEVSHSTSVEGIIVARKATSTLLKSAKAAGIIVFSGEVSMTQSITPSSDPKIKVKITKCN